MAWMRMTGRLRGRKDECDIKCNWELEKGGGEEEQ